MHHHQWVLAVASCLAVFGSSSSALAAAVPAPGGGGAGGGEQQKPLGRLPPMSGGVTRQYMSCEETYGNLWTTCGGGRQNSRSCYSPALGQSCCLVDNNYCDKGTWCAPVVGYCCLDSEDLETCARNAGFELPDIETLRDLASAGARESMSSRTWPEI
ncbi:hypothetical protein C8A01DRAFT_13952 [Parachaetomium inaequale]|uniref:Granulins domain-containing protein n=1 Tax=Parachaetomium inaequale TaxID=2588326 RepID=A0AAN6PK99_9PEZI|nr:hypothetical protein C8A01DRAFT_13952 [Parachaetomium inaequale]